MKYTEAKLDELFEKIICAMAVMFAETVKDKSPTEEAIVYRRIMAISKAAELPHTAEDWFDLCLVELGK